MSVSIDWRARAALAQGKVQHVPSPCISVCAIAARSGLCQGCWRTSDEIAAWPTLSDAGKRTVWGKIAQRATGQEHTP